MSTNLTISLICCNYCSIDLGTVYVSALTGLQLGSISWRLTGIYSILNSPHVPLKRCSYFGVISLDDVVTLHGGSQMS
jgi:hypothetical protein